MEIAQSIIGLLVMACIYFIPWGMAVSRKHHNRTAIGVTNLLLGWTLLGWVASLIWAATAVRGNA